MKFFKRSASTDKPNALDPFEVGAKDSLKQNESRPTSGRNVDNLVWMRSCEHEVVEPLAGKLTGSIPKWLKGTLLRNGPGNFKVGEYTFRHVFDSSALIHRFRIENGEVTYQRRFVETDTLKKNNAAQRIVCTEFGTKAMPDPCQSIFQRVSSIFQSNVDKITDNTNVSVYPFGDELYTLTEVPVMHRIDPNTLQTMDKVTLTDYVNIVHHTAHPWVWNDGTVYNIGMSRGKEGAHYNVVSFHPPRVVTDETGKKKELSMFDQATFVASVPSRWKLYPGYMHSFGITDNYFIIVEQPLTISAPKVMMARITGEPVANCLKWHENKSVLIHVLSRDSGRKIRTFTSETFFYFHVINQFETRDKQYVVMDLCGYRDATVIETLYIESLKSTIDAPEYERLIRGTPLRFVLPMKRPHPDTPPNRNLITIETVHQDLVERLNANDHQQQRADHNANQTNESNGAVTGDFNVEHENILQKRSTAYRLPNGNVIVKPELLCNLHCELPRVNETGHLGKEYRYFYAMSSNAVPDNSATLVKVDTFNKTSKVWQEKNVSPGEPIFVADPNGKNEDDGVVLSSLVWIEKNENRVGLLILDAATFKEIARTTFDTPGPVPRCLHGWFSLDKELSAN